MFEYVLEHNPYASWRSVAQGIDKMSKKDEAVSVVAERIKPHIEDVSDATLKLHSIHRVLCTTKAWKNWDKNAGLADLLQVPYCIQTDIKNGRFNSPQIKISHSPQDKLIQYWLDTAPNASWSTLAGVLYRLKEDAATTRCRPQNDSPRVDRVADLTLANLLTISQSLDDSIVDILWIPLGQSPFDSSLNSEEKREKLFREYLESHPAPSWEGVKWALYSVGGGIVSAHQAIREIEFLKDDGIRGSSFPTLPEEDLKNTKGLNTEGGGESVKPLAIKGDKQKVLKKLKEIVWDARACWRRIGEQLDLTSGDLDVSSI